MINLFGRSGLRLSPYLMSEVILSAMGMARVYQKGQVTIPKSVRDSTGIDIGDAVIVEARGDEIVVRRPRGVLEFEPPPTHHDLPWHATRRAAREDRVRRRTGAGEP